MNRGKVVFRRSLMEKGETESRHNKHAPYWAALLIIFLGTG